MEADPVVIEENRQLRRLNFMLGLVQQTIAQDSSLTYGQAAEMIENARTAALNLFPGKELAWDMIWRPRFQRLMRERFRLV